MRSKIGSVAQSPLTDAFVSETAQYLKTNLCQMGDVAVEAGRRLTICKQILGKKNFLPWATKEFGWNQSYVSRLMRASVVFKDTPTKVMKNFQYTAALLLTSKNTPAAARQEALKQARRSEVRHKDVVALLAKHGHNVAFRAVTVWGLLKKLESTIKTAVLTPEDRSKAFIQITQIAGKVMSGGRQKKAS